MPLLALLGYVGLDLIGLNFLSIFPLAAAFYMTVMNDKPLPKSEHQTFLVALCAVLALEVITFNFMWAIVIAGFTAMYMANHSANLIGLRKSKKLMEKVGNKIRKTVKNFN